MASPTVRRGEVHWCDADPVTGSEQAGLRPGVIVTRDPINRISPVVVLVPCTTYRGGKIYASDVLIKSTEGRLTLDSRALAVQIRAVSVDRLKGRLGVLKPETMKAIEEAICRALDIDHVVDTHTESGD